MNNIEPNDVSNIYETKLKIDDWVRFKNVTSMISRVKDISGDIIITENTYHIEEKLLIKWEPEVNEWCWFWTSPETLNLGRFKNMSSSYYVMAKNYSDNEIMKLQYIYGFCEPYLGEIPSIIKD